jgi:hypothetical protein
MFISPSCRFDDVEFTTATAGTKSLASGTEARIFEPGEGIANGMPTNESPIPIGVDA